MFIYRDVEKIKYYTHEHNCVKNVIIILLKNIYMI